MREKVDERKGKEREETKMLRPRPTSTTQKKHATNGEGSSISGTNKYDNAKTKAAPFFSRIFLPVLMALCVLAAVIAYDHISKEYMLPLLPGHNADSKPSTVIIKAKSNKQQQQSAATAATALLDRSAERSALAKLINRTQHNQKHCESIEDASQSEATDANNHTAHLSAFGFLDAVKQYHAMDPAELDKAYPYACELPPETECGETQFTVIFMAYNPDRLQKLINEARKMLTSTDYKPLVAEVLVVWNGDRHIDETDLGKKLLDMGKTLPLRVTYPLKAGFPNDLMNRYHPRIGVKTKAILYYDDDGPFYETRAVQAGFELWKRNSNAQIGAMARKIDIDDRQTKESMSVSKNPSDKFFVSHCPSDSVNYNYFTFANFDARMVLPSGSLLHSNFLCFLWHPLFEDVRKYIRSHPVNPDDQTVSMLVSQLAGRAPKVYSRRLPYPKKEEQTEDKEEQTEDRRRRLMDDIDWDAKGDAKQQQHDKQMFWGKLRSDVANSLARYFGSVNSGSLGWCYGTDHHEVKARNGENVCSPEMAKVGMLPWMNADNSAKDTCP